MPQYNARGSTGDEEVILDVVQMTELAQKKELKAVFIYGKSDKMIPGRMK